MLQTFHYKDWLHVRREQDKQVQELLENGIIGRI
jgi:hypothetical protein